MRAITAAAAALCLSNCVLLPIDREHGGARIEFFKDSIECEIAAVATDPYYSRFKLSTWNVKTGLDLTIIDTVGGDGKASVAIPSPTLPTISPSAGVTGKFTHTGHIDFATSVPDAITRFGKTCAGPNPSQSNLGLAAWIAATLDRIEPENHGGLSFTVDVDVTVNAAARFGFVFQSVNTLDAGPTLSREGVNHLVVTMGEPTAPAGPQLVQVVGTVKVVETRPAPPSSVQSPQGATDQAPRSNTVRITRARRPHYPARSPALEDPNLNRLLQQQAPVRLAPGTVLR